MSLTQQLTFEESRIGKASKGKDCEKEISENGDTRLCSNSAYLYIKTNGEIKYYCWHHSRETWRETIEKRDLFGGSNA